MIQKFSILAMILLLTVAVGCSSNDATTNANNANTSNATEPTTRPAPDNSEVTTSVDAEGVRTETRTFRDNPRIAKVVVTTKNGVRTGKAVAPSGEERDLDSNVVVDALEATGDKVADAAGFVAEKAEPVVSEVGDKTEDVKDQTVSGAKKVGDKTVEGAKAVGEGAKKVGEKTASGAKKAVKKVIP